jgi:hypothetical protein
MYKSFKTYKTKQDVIPVTSVDRRKSEMERPLDGLSELTLAFLGGRCAPPNLPAETKTKAFLMRVETVCLLWQFWSICGTASNRPETPRHGHRMRQSWEVDLKTILRLRMRLLAAFKIRFSPK